MECEVYKCKGELNIEVSEENEKYILYKCKREHYIEVAIVINIKNNKENRKYEVYKCEPEPIDSTPLGVSNRTDAPAPLSQHHKSSLPQQNKICDKGCRAEGGLQFLLIIKHLDL